MVFPFPISMWWWWWCSAVFNNQIKCPLSRISWDDYPHQPNHKNGVSVKQICMTGENTVDSRKWKTDITGYRHHICVKFGCTSHNDGNAFFFFSFFVRQCILIPCLFIAKYNSPPCILIFPHSYVIKHNESLPDTTKRSHSSTSSVFHIPFKHVLQQIHASRIPRFIQ